MRVIFTCPTCGEKYEATCSIIINNRIKVRRSGVKEIKKIEEIKINCVRVLTPEEASIIDKIEPYIKSGICADELIKILICDLHVKKSSAKHMASLVLEAYCMQGATKALR